MNDREPTMPSEVSGELGAFDRFATTASRLVSRAHFFAACVLLVLVWAPSYFLIGDVDTWQLIINTATTIVTFLMVALLQNSQTRSDHAIQHKLNAIADGLADLMEHLATAADDDKLRRDRMELHQAVGLEARETTSKHVRAVPPERR
jgi:low affinity Fe/Cu permease